MALTERTTSQSASPPSSSSLPSSFATYDGEEPKTPISKPPHADSIGHHDIKRKSGCHNLRRRRSSADMEDIARSVQVSPKALRRRRLQRSQSADAVLPSRSRFHTPDRYISQRTSPFDQELPFRTSQSPESLRKTELRSRRRDHNRDLFHSINTSTHQSDRGRRLQRNSPDFRPPHYLPAFVHGYDARPLPINAEVAQTATPSVNTEGQPTNHAHPDHLQQLHAIDTGVGFAVASTTTAPYHPADFLRTATLDDRLVAHEDRIALAMGIDRARRTILSSPERGPPSPAAQARMKAMMWHDCAWLKTSDPAYRGARDSPPSRKEKTLPTVPFRVLDAPNLKDDYYCSVLAYDRFSGTLAVALTQKVYLWTELRGVRTPPLSPARPSNYVTGLAFSSEEGQKSILAVSRQSGKVTLWSLHEQHPRFECPHPSPATCVAFRPRVTERISVETGLPMGCEELVVGDDNGRLYYYIIEWPDDAPGCMTLIDKFDAHAQNICGIAWSANGRQFATGGNDNKVHLFVVDDCVLALASQEIEKSVKEITVSRLADRLKFMKVASSANFTPRHATQTSISDERPQDQELLSNPRLQPSPVNFVLDLIPDRRRSLRFQTSPQTSDLPGGARLPSTHKFSGFSHPILRNKLADPDFKGVKNAHQQVFNHSAAVKAIAFAPWQPNLLATGGGSNDRQIHFHHTVSGAMLAVISVHAQVTSLTWSTTRREIAATFGYAQPEHPIRIAVFEWPSCECVVSIPWERKANGELGRALWAIPYPGGPNDPMIEQMKKEEEGFEIWAALQRTRNIRVNNVFDRRRHAEVLRSISNPVRVVSAQSHNLPPRPSPRGEGEVWASRTQEEGSLIIASCDQTVKFFEVWSGKSKGSGRALGRKQGVLGGSRVLEGFCKNMMVDEVGNGEETIR